MRNNAVCVYGSIKDINIFLLANSKLKMYLNSVVVTWLCCDCLPLLSYLLMSWCLTIYYTPLYCLQDKK